MDGGVGLYDMGAKKWDFLRDLVFYFYQDACDQWKAVFLAYGVL